VKERTDLSRRRALVFVQVTALLLLPRLGGSTIAEQHARLPPPAFCKSDIEGVWRSHSYNERFQEWTEFTLEIRRVKGNDTELIGKITNHNWLGPRTEEQPGPCRGATRFLLTMEAIGTFKEGFVSFRGTRWKLDEVLCGRLGGGWGYNLDHFTGRVDQDRQEFQSVNNDGGRDVNVPNVFRRIRCFDPPPPPRTDVKPPPFFPETRSTETKSGCGCHGAFMATSGPSL